MDKMEKALRKFSDKERRKIKKILEQILNSNFIGLDIKKLKGRDDIYRIRKGNLRIIYRLDNDRKIYILAIERRSNTTYNQF